MLWIHAVNDEDDNTKKRCCLSVNEYAKRHR